MPDKKQYLTEADIKVTDPTLGPIERQVKEATRRWLLEILNKKNWTAYRLAKEAGLSTGELSKVKADNRNPGFITICKIANAAGVAVPSPTLDDEAMKIMKSKRQK